MNITSPFVVVSLIVAAFFACILWSTGSKEDVSSEEIEHGHGH